jgi:hypothetical protein
MQEYALRISAKRGASHSGKSTTHLTPAVKYRLGQRYPASEGEQAADAPEELSLQNEYERQQRRF